MIAPIKLKRLIDLINAGKEHEFYTWEEWLKSREDVLKLDHYECQRCKDVKHKYRKAKIVHHVKHLRSRPDLALSIFIKFFACVISAAINTFSNNNLHINPIFLP